MFEDKKIINSRGLVSVSRKISLPRYPTGFEQILQKYIRAKLASKKGIVLK
tara:strand:+ start:85 stop:237 length:153 start_codon:yes stop_codon:yes gene_type:complete